MELADRSLAMAIAEGTATVDDIIQILESLQNLHSIRVSHLDIKPENILGVNGRWKFADFGSIVTGSSGAVVTPRYRAPEQLQNKPADQRADIWHIGLILYRLLAGHIPFISGNPEEILERIQSENIDLSCIPLEYQPVILKALAVNPDRRFQSAQEFKEALMKVNMTASDNVPAEPQYPDHIAQAIDFCLGKERFDVFAAYALVKDGEDPLAQMMAAVFEFNGKGTDMDVLSAIGRMESNLSALFKLAQSDPLAQFLLGEMYLRGIYLDENDKLGFELIRRSASRNFPLALCEFGTCYEEGCGVEVDHMKALINYSKSSEMGCIEALHRLGRIFETGNEYVQRDHQKAIDIFDECIDRGYYMAFYDLAATCVNGLDDLIDEPLFRKYGLMYLEKVGQHDSLVIFDDDSPLYAGNDRVEFVIVKDGVKVIPDEAFKNCTNLSCVSLGSTVETIGADAFSGTTVRTLNVPSSVRDIRPNAFKISTLTELKLHNGLVNIGTDAFFGNSLERLTIP
jgi:TPR repeat protein